MAIINQFKKTVALPTCIIMIGSLLGPPANAGSCECLGEAYLTIIAPDGVCFGEPISATTDYFCGWVDEAPGKDDNGECIPCEECGCEEPILIIPNYTCPGTITLYAQMTTSCGETLTAEKTVIISVQDDCQLTPCNPGSVPAKPSVIPPWRQEGEIFFIGQNSYNRWEWMERRSQLYTSVFVETIESPFCGMGNSKTYTNPGGEVTLRISYSRGGFSGTIEWKHPFPSVSYTVNLVGETCRDKYADVYKSKKKIRLEAANGYYEKVVNGSIVDTDTFSGADESEYKIVGYGFAECSIPCAM